MITYIKVDEVEYPFFFGMRELHTLTNARGIEFHEVDQRVTMDFDLLLEIYHLASLKGVRKHAKENNQPANQYAHLVLSKEAIEDLIDDDPEIMLQLEAAFNNSNVVQKVEESNKKKIAKSPTP